ncbi:acetyltransferase (GNAT) family protein [Humitalea rosea]|uniref:Acetyltransferase (GNAT) family protein n=1 Tax=Humitalea rosea TaxID=990373 RepID=A0A2W7HUH8_9PROT|nr:GNAT family N-acetyltransferase [Humitalea rosea]PZW37660.1 acetyltransferase (GNAT) family protein [Humitalea rosea]
MNKAIRPALRIERLAGPGLRALLPEVARLRIEVFRDWPYLYEGDQDSEARFLAAFSASPGAVVVLARAGDAVVGAATCQPMTEAPAAVQAPFLAAGMDPARLCYFGESVLRASHRGQGAGVAFFEQRLAAAREAGLTQAAFCAVRRDAADPRRPTGHAPLDGFWGKRGFAPAPGLAIRMGWREVGGGAEVPHWLDVWLRELGPAA